jgi:hypothetical protein
VGLILPSCNTEAMNLHLAEIAKAVAPGAHAVLLVDQAGWHLSAGLFIPANITIIPLPSICPELNPVEISGSICATTGSRTALQILRRYRRSLLLCLEYTRRPSLENHVHRAAPMGERVLITETWYKLASPGSQGKLYEIKSALSLSARLFRFPSLEQAL